MHMNSFGMQMPCQREAVQADLLMNKMPQISILISHTMMYMLFSGYYGFSQNPNLLLWWFALY